MPIRHLLPLLLAVLAAAPPALAQYKWRDENGRMVYSDLPPPASVAPSAVLRAPARPAPAPAAGGSGASAKDAAPAATGAVAPAAPAAAANPAAAAPSPSIADREMAFRKRRLEQEDAARKSADAEARSARVSAACDAARADARVMESGVRVGTVNERGERDILDDAQRATRLEAARRVLREACPST
jgi:hypothetical protein